MYDSIIMISLMNNIYIFLVIQTNDLRRKWTRIVLRSSENAGLALKNGNFARCLGQCQTDILSSEHIPALFTSSGLIFFSKVSGNRSNRFYQCSPHYPQQSFSSVDDLENCNLPTVQQLHSQNSLIIAVESLFTISIRYVQTGLKPCPATPTAPMLLGD